MDQTPVAYVPEWREDAPTKAGRYKWRLSCKWEDIERELDASGRTYSNRFLQYVAAIRVGGEWFY